MIKIKTKEKYFPVWVMNIEMIQILLFEFIYGKKLFHNKPILWDAPVYSQDEEQEKSKAFPFLPELKNCGLVYELVLKQTKKLITRRISLFLIYRFLKFRFI